MIEYGAKDGKQIQLRAQDACRDESAPYSVLLHGSIAHSHISISRITFPVTKNGSSGSEQQARDEDENRAGTLPGQLLRGLQVAT